MKVKCFSVRLESLVSISDKAFLARGWDGSEDIIPKSQYYGRDYSVTKTEAHWISAWILSKLENLQWSGKKEGLFDKDTGSQLPIITIKRKFADKKKPVENNEHPELIRESAKSSQ